MDRLAAWEASRHLFVKGDSMRIINIFTLTASSCALAAGIVMAVWHILDDRVDIAVPDDTQAVVLHDPNPPMLAWRPHIPDSVGTSSFACVSLPDADGNLSGAIAACASAGR